MHLPRRKLCLFILVLVQMAYTLEDTDEVIAETNNVNAVTEHGSAEAYIDVQSEEKNLSDKKKFIKGIIDVVASNVSSSNITKYNCLTDKTYGPVELVNATRLMELLLLEPGLSNRTRNDEESKQIPGTCVLILFYARWCIFSRQAAPHFNSLPRLFPHIKAVAIDAVKHQSFNAQYGIVGVPTVMFIHNGMPVGMFNGTVYTLEYFVRFITHHTNFQVEELVHMTEDYIGPVPSITSNDVDYCLVLSWMFIAACALYFTSQSRWWQQFVELVQNTWRESNAQHEHVD
ncbi:hypothetical protein KM043_011951 [Ampulex compressa]|nr:hypothetical protein KM043_011951 [Ampulex compressa]